MEYLGFAASLAMGVTLGLMGGGGSILTVPILVYLFSLPPTVATGYSLFVVGTTALIGSLFYIRRGDVEIKTGLAFMLPSVIGVNIARGIILPNIPSVVLQAGGFTLTKEILVMASFAALMVLASYSMIKKKADSKTVALAPLKRTLLIAADGLMVGLVAGFIGAGGGFLIIPVLVFMAGLSMRVAVGTSLMIIAFQSILGFTGDVLRGMSIDWSVLGPVMGFAVFGIVAGSAVAHKIKEQKLKAAFGWFVLAVGITILMEQIRRLMS